MIGYRDLWRRVRAGSAPALHAASVSLSEAMRWFDDKRGDYERLVSAAIPHVDPDGVIFDIGANIGYFSRLLAERSGFRGSLHLFEPLPHLASLCRETFAAPAVYRATVHEFALSDRDGEDEFLVAGNGNLGWNTLILESATDDMTRVTVPVRTFDTAGLVARPCFIKIDVEGAEYRVLRGMAGSLARWTPKPVILCEVGWGRNHPQFDDQVAVFDDLRALGYTFRNLDGTEVRIRDLAETTDILCLPTFA